MRTAICKLVMFSVLITLPACEDDPTNPDCCPPRPIQRQNLTKKWHVLNNIEYAYMKRDRSVYDQLVGTNFTFFFAPGDVGGNIPEQWGRVDEIDAVGRLFASNNQPGNPPSDPVCRSIRFDLQYDKDTMTWVEIVPDDFPNEKWYTATVFYTFTFEIEPDLTFITQNGARAQLTVRNRGTEQQPAWELVELRDLGGQTANAVSVGEAARPIASVVATKSSTWGGIKALYK
jgi:hypothetical protein